MKKKITNISSAIRKSNINGLIFILPLVAIIGIFLYFSFVFIIKNSFYKIDFSYKPLEYVGLRNYLIALQDKKFFHALFNNIVFALVDIFAGLSVGFILSIFLCFSFRGVRFYRTLFFVPTLLPNALLTAVFASMLQYNFGTLNTILRKIGLEILAKHWLSTPGWAYISVMSIGFYLIGLPMMYYTAQLMTLEPSIFESAIIDGAGLKDMIWRILFPLLKNSHKTVTLTIMLSSFRVFERVFLLTAGGPGYATEVTGTYIYVFFSQHGQGNIGFVSALSVIVLVIAIFIGTVQLIIYRKN